MKVLSLFDWISCARVALERAWLHVDIYYASEIDKFAIQVSDKNYGDIVQIWDVCNVNYTNHSLNFHRDWYLMTSICWTIDLLIWWSPCQDLSIAKNNRKWLDGNKSWLFREYVRILKEVNPKYFILENVASMPKEAKDTITKELWVEPVMINAALVSAQNRKRLFRTNIPWVTQPGDRWILLKDILESWEVDERMVTNWKSFVLTASYNWDVERNSVQKKQRTMVRVWHLNKWWQGDRVYSQEWKSVTLSANWWGGWAKTWLYITQRPRGFNKWWEFHDKSPTISSNAREQNNKLTDWHVIRKLTPVECERLQGLPDNYTAWISNTQRYKCLWNAFNVDVISHILSFI